MTQLTYFSCNWFLSNYIQKTNSVSQKEKTVTSRWPIFSSLRAITSFESFHHVEAKACKLHCRLQFKSYREGYRNWEAARFFNVDELNIHLWRKNKTNFKNCDRCKRADCRGKPHWPELEEEINKCILKERDNGKAVSILIFFFLLLTC
ncbi:UNVERIFIED_CONTAM: hypothetical protein NCL1_42769 [Trichonephila clavipes]